MEMYAEMHLVFDNDFDVYSITKAVGIVPSECKCQSETKICTATKKQIEGFWTLQSKVFEEWDLKIVLDDLTSIITDKLPEIKAICDKNGGKVMFDIVPSFHSDKTPALYFERDFLEIVHYLNATIQIDMYVE